MSTKTKVMWTIAIVYLVGLCSVVGYFVVAGIQ